MKVMMHVVHDVSCCFFLPLVVSYEPQADPAVAHHMLVFGCNVLKHGYHDSSSW